MFEPAFTGGGNIPNEIWNKAKIISTYFKESVRKESQKNGIPAHICRIFQPCNAWSVLDKESIHFAFSEINAGGLPRKWWEDKSSKGAFNRDQVIKAAIEYGIVDPIVISFDIKLIEADQNKKKEAAQRIARIYVQKIKDDLANPRAIAGYEGLQPLINNFMKDHPNFEKNVFIGMRFRSNKHFTEIYETTKNTLTSMGYKGLRADEKIYPQDDDLWDNICVYMMGCKYGIFIFEDIDEREFNPNVPLEYGFMRAMNKRILLLKEQRLPKMPSDITGKLYKAFDMFNIKETIESQIKQWISSDIN